LSSQARSRSLMTCARPEPPRALVLLLDRLLQARTGCELGYPRRGDVDPLACVLVTAFSCAPLRAAELAEAGEDDLAAALESPFNRLQDGIDRVSGFLLA